MRINSHRATFGGFEPRVQLSNYHMKPGMEREHFSWCTVKSDKMKDFPDVVSPKRPFEVTWIDLSPGDPSFTVEIAKNRTERTRPLRVSVVGCFLGFTRYGAQPASKSIIAAIKAGRTHYGVNTFEVPANQSIRICGL